MLKYVLNAGRRAKKRRRSKEKCLCNFLEKDDVNIKMVEPNGEEWKGGLYFLPLLPTARSPII